MRAHISSATFALALTLAQWIPAQAETVLRAVMAQDLKILDPVWTSSIATRNYGYMVYDTLFAEDDNGEIQPQMLEKYDVSNDELTYTFTLRTGLLWHDGQPVTSEDCIASIKRWAAKDASGQMLMTFTDGFDVVDGKTFRLKLRVPTGLVLAALGKPSAIPAFMMPKRVAETLPDKQISDFVGSGPFVFKKDDTCCLRFLGDVTTAQARLASGWLARLYREGVEPSGSL
jgi:peptide/nickel transport system substrate-binding protein